MSALRLYVWHGVLTDYTSGVMFALASSVDEAREMICPRWNEAERRIREGASPERPFGREPGVNGGAGYCVGSVHEDLRGEPEVYDAPVGFAVWGGG